jgi:hypothetical protein
LKKNAMIHDREGFYTKKRSKPFVIMVSPPPVRLGRGGGEGNRGLRNRTIGRTMICMESDAWLADDSGLEDGLAFAEGLGRIAHFVRCR